MSVSKASSTTRVRVKQARVVVSRTKATVKIDVEGDHGVAADGRVRISVTGKDARTVRLKNGSFVLKLGAFDAVGKKVVKVQFLGSDRLERSTDTVTFRVTRK